MPSDKIKYLSLLFQSWSPLDLHFPVKFHMQNDIYAHSCGFQKNEHNSNLIDKCIHATERGFKYHRCKFVYTL